MEVNQNAALPYLFLVSVIRIKFHLYCMLMKRLLSYIWRRLLFYKRKYHVQLRIYFYILQFFTRLVWVIEKEDDFFIISNISIFNHAVDFGNI